MGKVSDWHVLQDTKGEWTVIWPNVVARVHGFETREDAHAWIMDYLVEMARMSSQTATYQAERLERREWERQLQAAVLLDPGPEKKS